MILMNVKKVKMVLQCALLTVLFIVSGCGTGEDLFPSAKVAVQLIDAGLAPYHVDQMRVVIQKAGEPELSGVTNAQGIATITVPATGVYNVLRVTGADATSLAEGSDAGREFKKDNPIVDPYPRLTFIYSFNPAANVTALGGTYQVNAYVPIINKVTVLKVGSVTSATSGESTVAAGATAFAGRVMITNLNCNDNRAGLQFASSDANGNSMMLYMNTTAGHPTPEISYTRFFGGPAFTETATGFANSYTQAGPIYFEAPGTDSGDWALGYNVTLTDLKIRNAFGGADETRNFPAFDGGAGNHVLRTWSTAGGVGHTYSFSYRIFKFDAY